MWMVCVCEEAFRLQKGGGFGVKTAARVVCMGDKGREKSLLGKITRHMALFLVFARKGKGPGLGRDRICRFGHSRSDIEKDRVIEKPQMAPFF